MTVLVLPVHPGSGTVEVLPRATGESCPHHCRTLGMERLLVLNQEIGDLSCTDIHPHRVPQFQDFRLTHPTCIVEGEHPCSDSRPKLPFITRRKISQIRLLIA